MLQFTHVEDAGEHEDEIRVLVAERQASFNPPLEARYTTTDTDLQDTVPKDINEYVESLLSEPTILAHDETGELAGLLSYRCDYTNDAISAYQPSHHITVVIVNEDHPEEEIYAKLINVMIKECEKSDEIAFITARIPANDETRHELLEDTLGFEAVHRARDARPDGSDTLWFAREV